MEPAMAIKTLLKDNHKTQTWLTEQMGYSTVSSVANMLRRNNMNVTTLCEICELLGYEVTIQPSRKGRRPDGQILIERPAEKGSEQ